MLVAPDGGLTSPVHTIPLPSPVSPVSVRPSTSSRYSRPPMNHSCSFASHNCANPPALPPSPTRPPPLPPISAYADAIRSPTSATRLVGATCNAGQRRSVSFSEPASARPATSSWAKDDVSIVSEKVPLDKQSPYDEDLWVGADQEEVLPVAQPCYLPGDGSVGRAFSTESEEYDDDSQSVESASVFPVRSARTDGSTVRTSCDRTTETEGAPSTQPESSVRAASLKLSRRPRRLSLPMSLQSRTSSVLLSLLS